MQLLTESSEEEAARITGLLEDLKAEVAETLTSFTQGDLKAVEFKDKMDSMGIKLDCSVEQLEAAQGNEPARGVLQEAVSSQFQSQVRVLIHVHAVYLVKYFLTFTHAPESGRCADWPCSGRQE